MDEYECGFDDVADLGGLAVIWRNVCQRSVRTTKPRSPDRTERARHHSSST
jgi:hypothetical protein